jgi:DNA-directed RNA polymerase subunit D
VAICPKKILQIKGGKLEITDILKCTLCRDCIKACPKDAIDVSWDETTVIFNIESTGALPVDQIVKEATNILEGKTNDFAKEISKLR